MEILTIGHSNVPAYRMVELLHQHDVVVLVDVRSRPYSRYNPQFNRETWQHTLEEAGLQYRYMGQHLGGRPADPACYEDGQVRFERIARLAGFQQGIAELIVIATGQRTVLMCAEEDPLRCHRHLLLTPVLLERGVTVWHIRGDGRLERADRHRPEARQLTLF